MKAFLRNHPLFAVVLFLLIGAGLALSVLTVMAQGDRAAALRASLAADDEARALWTRPVSPIQANVEAMEAEYNRRVDALNGLRAELGFVAEERRRGVPDISATYDGNARALLSELVGFVDRFERQSPAPAETTSRGSPQVNGFAFRELIATNTPPPDEALPVLHRQRLVLGYLLEALLDAEPEALLNVQREPVGEESAPATDNALRGDLFDLPASVSAARAGTIEAQAFRIIFEGHTQSLRLFLAKLAEQELPLVVRGLEVEAIEEETRSGRLERRPAASAPSNPFGGSSNARPSSITNPFANAIDGGGSATEETPVAAEAVPIVSSNRSRFTVVVECVWIVAPEVTRLPTEFDEFGNPVEPDMEAEGDVEDDPFASEEGPFS